MDEPPRPPRPPLAALIAHLLLHACASAGGDHRVIGSPRPIAVRPGDDVVLPCHVEPPVDVARLTVEWSRFDVKPDPGDQLSRVDYVHLYRRTRQVPGMMISSYVGRTALFAEGLREGNISLRLTNVTPADAGRYRCFIPKLRSPSAASVVRLVVETNPPNARTTGLPPFPGNLRTPAATHEAHTKYLPPGDRLRWIVAAVAGVLLILAAGCLCAQRMRFKTQRKMLRC